jgi:exodeoxyribonuclease V alpha subunit
MDAIYGILERITFHNEENDFVVARVKEKGKKDLTTVVGGLSGINPGESLRLSGKWVNNSKYGRQFQVEKFETVVPATVNGIEKYLGSGLIKGIGPVMARRIVKMFGLDTLEVIEQRPGELSRIEGIGEKRIAMITKAWEEQKEIKEIMVFLQGYGVSASYSAKIFKKYGRASIKAVRENPYRLAADIRGIGFATADRIAQNMGIDPHSVMRAEEGIIHVLNELTGEGHVYYPRGKLLEQAAEMLQINRDAVLEEALAGLIKGRRVIVEEHAQAVYLMPLHLAEAGLAGRLCTLSEEPLAARPVDTGKAVSWLEDVLGTKLAAKQKKAVDLAARSKVLVITGGPGTGKTTIIKAIINVFRAMKLKILLAAPTGRAAKKMQEATGYEARTIHRLLEYSPQEGGFQRDRDYPLEADVVIVDEASMIDTILMYHLVKAVPPRAGLILVGDINQLPSVGPGSVLRDVITSGRFPVVTLTEIFRQARESRIVTNAHLVNQGKFPNIRRPPAGQAADFYFIKEEDPEKALDKILLLCKKNIARRFGYHPVRDIQVLTPMHRGLLGVSMLNERLQEVLNPNAGKTIRGYKRFKYNDKVMQVVNNYQKEVFNGDIGYITAISPEEQEVSINFDGRTVNYDFSETDEIMLAYAVSIHKAQGSEYPAVVVPVMTQHYVLLQRNLIYTAITRGKKLVILVGSKKALAIAVRNNKPGSRYTMLKERLLQEPGP